MSDDELTVRPVETEEEITTFYRLAVQAFGSPDNIEEEARMWRREDELVPDFLPRQRRGVFLGDAYVGGCSIGERVMHVGAGRLPTACVGVVVTHPDFRMRGIGTAILRDAAAFAEKYGQALVLLDGIPNFYHRFGYADIWDLTEHVIEPTAVPAEAPEGYTTRHATIADAPAMLALYERHYGSYTGSFARTAAFQANQIRTGLDLNNPRRLAVDAHGEVRGYLGIPRAGNRARAFEVAADNWPAAAALLHQHATFVDLGTELIWPLPLDSRTYYALADNLSIADTSGWPNPQRGWAIRSETYAHRRAAWMARIVSLRRVVEGLLPAFRERVERSGVAPLGTFVLRSGDEACAIELAADGVRLLNETPANVPVSAIAPEQLVQLVFGYRPASYVAAQPEADVPSALVTMLDTLFPTGHAWIPGSDAF